MKMKVAGRIFKLAVLIVVAMFGTGAIAVARNTPAQDTTDKSLQSATGCLRKNPVGDVYALTDENGKLWDLQSRTVQLNRHVGQTVEVTGTIPKGSRDSSDTSPQNHLIVTKLEMVRASCKQP